MAFLNDGYQTLITFAANGGIRLREKEVKPPGLDGGGGIDTTTMRSVKYRSKAPKSLQTVEDMTLQVSYDPGLYTDIAAMINVRQLITVTFPDGKAFSDIGWVDKFQPTGLKEGEFPLAEITIIFGNTDAGNNPVNPTLPA